MDVPSTRSTASLFAPAESTTSRIRTKTLGQDDFLKLLVTQLTTQDPLNPQTDTEFIAQMAQFSSLEQAQLTNATLSQLREEQRLMQASALLGRTVELLDGQDRLQQGRVDAVHLVDGRPMILVGEAAYELSQVVSISSESTQSPTPPRS